MIYSYWTIKYEYASNSQLSAQTSTIQAKYYKMKFLHHIKWKKKFKFVKKLPRTRAGGKSDEDFFRRRNHAGRSDGKSELSE